MNQHGKNLADLIEQARRETAPPIDVAGRVIDSIQPSIEPQTPDWPLWFATAMSVAAALAVMVLAAQQGVFVADPLAELMSPVIPMVQ